MTCLHSGRMRQRVVGEGGLAGLRKAHREHRNAEERLRREILFAHLDGSSLRAIAMTVDLSPESVRTIIREENAKREQARLRLERAASPRVASPTSASREEATRRNLARKWRLPVQGLDK